MSSIKSSFGYDDFEYESTIDNKFVDDLSQLILQGNVKKVKEFISTILTENDKLFNERDDYNKYDNAVHIDSPMTVDDYNVDDYYEGDEYEDSQSSLMENKVVEITFANEFTPLMLAAQEGIPELVEYFVSINFDINKKIQKTGLTALLAACSSELKHFNRQHHAEKVTRCIELLIEAGANKTDTLEKSKQSPLHLVVSQNNIHSCKYLIDLVDVNCKNSQKSTPLMIAATRGYVDIVCVLLEAEADLTLKNANGLSAVELAMINNHSEIVKLLIRPTDNLDFYRAWSVVYKDLVEVERSRSINESFVKKFYSSKYFSDPIACMCASLNLTHLQPILEKHGITFSKLRSMSDSDMQNVGIHKFSDRKCLLNLMQEVHKVKWTHQTSLYTPNYKLSITPFDMLDVVKNGYEHLEFLESSIRYIGYHLSANPSYYLNYAINTGFSDKCVEHCQFAAYKGMNIRENICQIQGIFNKMYQCGLDEDISSQLNDEEERVKQEKLTKRLPAFIKAGIVLSGVSIISLVLMRSRIVNL